MRKIDRFDKYMAYKGLNDNKVTVQLGLSVGTLGKSRKENRDLSDKVIEQILNFYIELNRIWLLTGEGEMLNKVEASSGNENKTVTEVVKNDCEDNIIRYWKDIDVTATPAESFNDIHETYTPLVLPEFRDCSDAVNVYGDSMTPLYKNGDIVIFKEWKESFIEFGNIYLVITRSGHKMLKYVRPGRDEQYVSCESENPLYAPFQVQKNDIAKLYIVKGSISRNLL